MQKIFLNPPKHSVTMEGGREKESWSEQVEDLVEDGDIEKAISVLESQLQTLKTSTNNPTSQLDNLRISSTLSDLAHLYSTMGFSLKADHTRQRARDLKISYDSSTNSHAPCEGSASDGKSHSDGRFGQSPAGLAESSCCSESPDNGNLEKSSESAKTTLPDEEGSDDDWEAMADCSPEELLSSQSLPVVSKPLEEKVKEVQAPKRRGRGTFTYTAYGLHKNGESNGTVINNNIDIEIEGHGSDRDTPARTVKYGTRHVVVLADFPPTTTTIHLEKLLRKFKDSGFVIRWVSDTVALAVFKSPTAALEACNQIQCSFTMRVLDENDPILMSIPLKDLEPPRERPKTSTTAATRLIAQGMGIKLPTAGFGSKELKKQEQARRDRIVSRQNLRDDAWGDDV